MKKQVGSKKADICVCCNVCGRELERSGSVLIEDYIEITKEWGYFSEHDLEVHSFNMCERCYNKFTSIFKIPVTVSKVKEVL